LKNKEKDIKVDKSKKILLITENLGSGGAERQICGLAVMLTQTGYTCRLITYVYNQYFEQFLHDNGVDYQFVAELRNKFTRVAKIAKYVRNYKPDVVLSFLSSVNMTMCLAKPYFNAKLIVSERNNNTCITMRDRLRYNLYRRADAIVPNSNSQAEFIRKNFPFLSKKVQTIINFVDSKRFSPTAVPAQNSPLRIITVARYSAQKNVLIYMDAIRKVKDMGLPVHFDWYGDRVHNNKCYYAEVEKVYDSLDIADYLTLHDSSSTIEEEFRKADVFCLPSLFEGYPNVVVEAMACQLPVLCSNVYENPHIIEDCVNGFLFDPSDSNDIAASIKKMTGLSAEERLAMGKRNRELCVERNTKEAFLRNYKELIDRLRNAFWHNGTRM
jgi:glycosyltransferase involved in cell wall biosynthesis